MKSRTLPERILIESYDIFTFTVAAGVTNRMHASVDPHMSVSARADISNFFSAQHFRDNAIANHITRRSRLGLS